jgi:hypothetical protein
MALNNVTQEIKNLKLSADDRLLLENGLIDQNGNVQQTGENTLWPYILKQYKTQVVHDIRKAIKAKKAAEEGETPVK